MLFRSNELGSPNSQPRPPSLNSNSEDSVPGQNIAEVRSCRPKKHIFFLKTHKTASSTILNILYRYGDSQNLTFALPYNMHSQLFYPNLFASYFVEGEQSRSKKKFHIMCNHLRLNLPEVSPVMDNMCRCFTLNMQTICGTVWLGLGSTAIHYITMLRLGMLQYLTIQDFILQ